MYTLHTIQDGIINIIAYFRKHEQAKNTHKRWRTEQHPTPVVCLPFRPSVNSSVPTVPRPYIVSVRNNYNPKSHKYVFITTYQPDTRSNPNRNPNHNPTTTQHAIVNIQLNIVTRSTRQCGCTVFATLACNCRFALSNAGRVVDVAVSWRKPVLGLRHGETSLVVGDIVIIQTPSPSSRVQLRRVSKSHMAAADSVHVQRQRSRR